MGVLNIAYIPLVSGGINSFQINQNTKQTNKLGNHGISFIYFVPLTVSLVFCFPLYIPNLCTSPDSHWVSKKGTGPKLLLPLFARKGSQHMNQERSKMTTSPTWIPQIILNKLNRFHKSWFRCSHSLGSILRTWNSSLGINPWKIRAALSVPVENWKSKLCNRMWHSFLQLVGK